jgi:hypothetical protein
VIIPVDHWLLCRTVFAIREPILHRWSWMEREASSKHRVAARAEKKEVLEPLRLMGQPTSLFVTRDT